MKIILLKLLLIISLLQYGSMVHSQNNLVFRDSILDENFGSYLLEPTYNSLSLDTFTYSVNLSSLFIPYPNNQFCEGTVEDFLVTFHLIKKENKESKIVQIFQGHRKTYPYSKNTSITLSVKCDNNISEIDNYQLVHSEESNYIYLLNKTILVADVLIDDKIFNICTSPFVGNFNQDFFFRHAPHLKFRKEDVVQVENQFFKINEFNFFTRKGEIEKVEDSRLQQFGFSEGKILKEFSLIKERVVEKEQFKKIVKKDKYFLFYFWGEWCQPCISKIGNNKKLFEKIDTGKINIVNIAGIFKKNSREKTLNIIDLNEIPYYHLLDNGNLIISLLRIDTYPTYLLVGADGMIQYKSIMKTPEEVQRFLKTMKSNMLLK